MAADAPDRAKVVSFPVFNNASGFGEELSPGLARFLDDEPSPPVFAPGTFAARGAGAFYAPPMRLTRCCFRARAIVHHGGIGTTGQALRAGKPQLIVPHMGDQHDHADRVTRLGVGLSLRAE